MEEEYITIPNTKITIEPNKWNNRIYYNLFVNATLRNYPVKIFINNVSQEEYKKFITNQIELKFAVKKHHRYDINSNKTIFYLQIKTNNKISNEHFQAKSISTIAMLNKVIEIANKQYQLNIA